MKLLGLIAIEFHMQPSALGSLLLGPGHLTKMPSCPYILGKPKKSSSPEPMGGLP